MTISSKAAFTRALAAAEPESPANPDKGAEIDRVLLENLEEAQGRGRSVLRLLNIRTRGHGRIIIEIFRSAIGEREAYEYCSSFGESAGARISGIVPREWLV